VLLRQIFFLFRGKKTLQMKYISGTFLEEDVYMENFRKHTGAFSCTGVNAPGFAAGFKSASSRYYYYARIE